MYVLTNDEMRKADEYTIGERGVSSLALMERAGKALADEAERLAPEGDILCVCGGGNNGGDGFVCARVLRSRGRGVDVVFFADRISDDCRVNMAKWLDVGGDIKTEIDTDNDYALIVDCLVGTGLRGGLQGKNAQTAKEINIARLFDTKVLSADIPSGVNGENGLVETVAVQADVTLCIGELKFGTTFADGLDYAGKVKRVDIGIFLPAEDDRYTALIDGEMVAEWLPKRKRNVHKGTFGKAAIVAGSEEYTGAAYLAAAACLRAGAGYTTLFVPKNILPYYVLKSPEILLKSLNDGGRYEFIEENMQQLLAYDAIAYGMGMGVSEDVAKGAVWLIEHFCGRLVLDADGLNSLAAYYQEELPAIFAKKKGDVVLTPHCKEFARLTGKSVENILESGLTAPRAFAQDFGVNVLLKGAASVLASAERTALNVTGTAGQAKAGSGDVLSGAIVGLCAMGMSAYEGAALGAYFTGKAAELATAELGEISVTATDVIAYMGRAFLQINRETV
ncbi:MAG: NAD(P)H-hydrate dehydratase [Clostridia bacterium]|nr:NAD(P)H-hydrate dehydratase [Clostridia bacterium]